MHAAASHDDAGTPPADGVRRWTARPTKTDSSDTCVYGCVGPHAALVCVLKPGGDTMRACRQGKACQDALGTSQHAAACATKYPASELHDLAQQLGRDDEPRRIFIASVLRDARDVLPMLLAALIQLVEVLRDHGVRAC